jgi:preprotein translocase subunit SecD
LDTECGNPKDVFGKKKMKTRLKNVFTNVRVITLLVFVIFALIAIQPQIFGTEGVVVKSVAQNSTAALAGMQNPSSHITPLGKEKILSINGEEITDPDAYYNNINDIGANRTIRIETSKGFYTLQTGTSGDLGIKINEAPTSNIRKGLDLEGGTRVLLKPEEQVSEDDLEITIANLKERLNVYGLSDVIVRAASDLAGDDFILIEMAGVTEDEVRDLLAKQGKFEAMIGNETVFFGGKKDITYVCRSADCSGIDPQRGCSQVDGGYACSFFFSITLSPEAADRQASLTNDLSVVTDNGNSYLSDDLTLMLDDVEVDSLRIGAELKGRATTNIQISGSEVGPTQAEAVTNTLSEMKRLQTIIITGSLPVKLEVVKMDTISPSLGKEFLNNIVFVGLLAILSVIIVVSIRYRNGKVVVPMVLTIISEMVLILGFASLVGWNLDLAAIAGIIIVAGTGVDHLIVITDETLKGEVIADWKKRIKNAMFIVFGAYLTTCAGMLPLWFAGAGLLKGFAFTTIVGISFGVLVARPAYAAIIEQLLKE